MLHAMTPLTLLVALATAYSVRLTGFFPPIVERWDDPTVTYSIQLAGSDDLPPEVAVDSVRQAFASWQDLACATVRFVEVGDAPNPRTNMALGARANGINEVHWVESDWPFGAYVLGVTVPKVAPDGRLVESDIAFNGEQVQWTASGNGGMDLESVAVHEIGHFIGIQHNLGPYPLTLPPTMAPWVAGGIQNRSLTDDDIAAACFLYPETPWTCASDADCPELLSQTFETGDYYSGRFRCGDDLTCSILERFVPHRVGLGERCHRADECRDGLGCHPVGDASLCTRGCTPSAPDCPEGYRCDPMSAPLEALGVCLPTDGIIFAPAAGPEGCLDSSICAGDAACLPTPADPELRRCATFCGAAAPCPAGQRCHSYGGPSGACFDASLFPAEPAPEPGPEAVDAAEPTVEPPEVVAEPDVSRQDASQDPEVDAPSDSRARRSGCASGPPTPLVGILLLGLRRNRSPRLKKETKP
jgi:hypothetical protein